MIRFLHDEICDYALCSYLKDQPEITFTHLFDQELVAIVANDHPLAQKECIDFAELANVPMVLTRDKTFYIENLFRQQKSHLLQLATLKKINRRLVSCRLGLVLRSFPTMS